MIIIRHSKAFLSVYANNSQVLVKEGQGVTRGQKIAEMGAAAAVKRVAAVPVARPFCGVREA